MMQLLDMGFQRAPSQTRVIKPQPIPYIGNAAIASLSNTQKKKRLSTSVKFAQLPQRRPSSGIDENVAVLVARAVMDEEIEAAVASAVLTAARAGRDKPATSALPMRRPKEVQLAEKAEDASLAVQVARGDQTEWSVELGQYPSRTEAERLLLVTALQEFSALDGAFRRIDAVREKGQRLYRARFVGLTEKEAQRTCARLTARQSPCETVSPGT